MIQKESRLEVADNSGAKVAMVIGIMGVSSANGRFTRVAMGIGDRVMCAIKEAIPNGQVKSGDKAEAVIVRVKSPTRRNDGSYVRFDSNACVLVDKEGNPKGTRIFGAVARELREKNFMKIVSLATEVI
ncbi:MAG: ribosomal protein [Pseudomonadota bacterium]|jgi:large subunit ribosomal protein L14|nr:50S ribosomal protein L14 [Pseudomonadota bacterium]